VARATGRNEVWWLAVARATGRDRLDPAAGQFPGDKNLPVRTVQVPEFRHRNPPAPGQFSSARNLSKQIASGVGDFIRATPQRQESFLATRIFPVRGWPGPERAPTRMAICVTFRARAGRRCHTLRVPRTRLVVARPSPVPTPPTNCVVADSVTSPDYEMNETTGGPGHHLDSLLAARSPVALRRIPNLGIRRNAS